MTVTKKSSAAKVAETTADKPANIAPAKSFDTSGAAQQLPPIDTDHPAVETDPRAGTSVEQNRIDFNDPCLSDAEAVQKNLGAE